MNTRKVGQYLVSLFLVLTIVNCVQSSQLPVNRLVRDALRRQQREALADTSNDDNEEDGGNAAITTESSAASAAPSPKPKSNNSRVDWNEIERTWNEWKEDNEVTKKWNDMEKGLKKGVKAVLRSIFPRIVSMSSDTKVSGNCSAGILKWLISLRSLKDWSIRMLDAIGKPSSGILEGQVTMFGNYHECLNIRVMEEEEEDVFDDEEEKEEIEKTEAKEFFRGKYCILEFKPWLPKKPPFYGMTTKLKALERPKNDDSVLKDIADLAVFLNFVSFRMDLCVPSLCTRNDIQKVVGLISRLIDIRGKVVRCEVDEVPLSKVSNPQVTALLLLILLFFTFAILTVVGTCSGLLRAEGSLVEYLRSLTWSSSVLEIFSDHSYQNKKHVSALYGLRTVLLVYIIMVHTAVEVNFQFFRDVLWIRDMALSFPAQFLTKSSYNFDMFIMISAFTMAYNVGSGGASKGLKFLARKFLRVTPIVMIATGWLMILPIAKKIYRGGPTWGDFIPQQANACEHNGLVNLFVEMQLYLAFVPFMAFARKASKAMIIFMLTLIVIAGFICNIFTVYKYELPPHLMWTLPDPQQRDFYYQVHYFKPWTHLSVFAIGIGAGLLCKNRSKKSLSPLTFPMGNGVMNLILWCASLVTIFSLIYLHHDWVMGVLPPPMVAGIYDGVHRILVSLATAWIVFSLIKSCEEDRRSFVANLLGSRFMVVLGRLTLVAYTIHPIVQLIFLGTQSAQLFSGPIVALYVVIGNIVMTYLHSFIISIIWEVPITSGLKARQTSSGKFGIDSNSSSGKEFRRNSMNNNKTSNTLSVVSSVNGDIEMSKHVERL